MPYKDKDKPEIKARKIVMIKERWDIFDKEKAKLEMKYGFMSNGGFLEYLLISNELIEKYEHRIKRENIKNKGDKTKKAR